MGKPFFNLKSVSFALLFLVANSLNASGLAIFFAADSLPKIYKGYRLSLANFTVEKESKKATTLRCMVVNTGRLPLIFSEKSPAPIELVIELDTTELPPKFINRMHEIEAAILRQKINLAPGKFRQDLELEMLNDDLSVKKKKAEKPAQKEAKPIQKEPELVEKAPVSGKPAQKPAEKLPTELPEKKPEKSAPPPATTSKKAEKKPDEPVSKFAEPEVFPVSKKCGDLVFDTLWLIKKSKKMATLGFRIRNIGSGSANIGGDSPKKQTDNLAVNVYFSGGKKLSRGAILADGIFIGTDPKGNSLLLPGEKFEAEIQIPLENQTRFMPNVIFELDPFQTVVECDKTNNTRAMSLPEN